jgi:hypothetical protein
MNRKTTPILLGIVFLLSVFLFFSSDFKPAMNPQIRKPNSLDPITEKNGVSTFQENSIGSKSEKDEKPLVINRHPLHLRSRNQNELSFAFVKSLITNPDRFSEQVIFQQGTERFTSIPGIVAIPTKDLTESEAQSQIGRYLGLSVIQSDNPDVLEKGYPLVANQQRGSLALVTGNVKVSYHQPINAQQFEYTFGLKLIENFPEIHLSLFSTEQTNVRKIVEIVNSLRSQTGVESVSLDIIDRIQGPN